MVRRRPALVRRDIPREGRGKAPRRPAPLRPGLRRVRGAPLHRHLLLGRRRGHGGREGGRQDPRRGRFPHRHSEEAVRPQRAGALPPRVPGEGRRGGRPDGRPKEPRGAVRGGHGRRLAHRTLRPCGALRGRRYDLGPQVQAQLRQVRLPHRGRKVRDPRQLRDRAGVHRRRDKGRPRGVQARRSPGGEVPLRGAAHEQAQTRHGAAGTPKQFIRNRSWAERWQRDRT